MTMLRSTVLLFALTTPVFAQQGGAGAIALTIYNQDFAVARTTVDLNLIAGVNQVTTTNVTSQMEPDSVVLRDPTGKITFKIDEQNYDAGVVDQNSLMQKYEGQTIQFWRGGTDKDGKPLTTSAKIIRAGNNNQGIYEVDGAIQFFSPGQPIFPDTTADLLLKPTLRWEITAPKAAHLAAEFAYMTHGMGWQATYNVVAPDLNDVTGPEKVDLTGLVTIQNRTGTDFPQARIKLMAGDVAKIRDMSGIMLNGGANRNQMMYASSAQSVGVTQQAFDDFHLYDLNRTVSLSNGETKEIGFIEATGVTMNRVYEYDGTTERTVNQNGSYFNQQSNFGTGSNPKVNVRAEIKNSTANHLGMPLPSGRIRLYRRDAGGQMEFIGEGTISHTPAEQTVKVPVGSAFDVTGARRQTDFKTDQRARTVDENFEITLKNQKSTPVNVAVVEHMLRGQNWALTAESADYTKRDSDTIEFPVTVPAAGETKVTYTVHYTW